MLMSKYTFFYSVYFNVNIISILIYALMIVLSDEFILSGTL